MIYAAKVVGNGLTAGTYYVTPQYTRIDGVEAPNIEALPINGLTPSVGDVVFCAEGINDFSQSMQLLINDNGGAFPIIFASLAQLLVFSVAMHITGNVTLGEGGKKMTLGDEVKTQVQKIIDQIKQLRTDFNSWTPVPNDGGAALKTKIAAGFATKPDADLSNILSEKHQLD